MAAITWTDVTQFASGLAAVDATAQTAILNYVNNVHDVDLFGGESGPMLHLLRIYLAAHLGSATALSTGTSSTGYVASETAGGLSRTYIYPHLTSMTALQSTAFGREYSTLLAASPARVGIAF